MTTLAPKLPWQHAFAGGFNRLGGQALPTDADAIDYLNRVATADGAAVEVGVAQAIDVFVRGCKADSAGYAGDPTRTNWEALQACCIMAGARTISGALVPLKTPYGAELVDIENLPTPTLYDASGSTAVWNAGTRTASNATTGTTTTYPRFYFQVGMTSGKRYRVRGVLSGDLSRIYGGGFRINGSGYIAVDLTTGAFDAIATAGTLEGTDGGIELLLNGYFIASVTIESLSIREDSFTPTAQGGWTSSEYSRGGSTPGLKGNGSTLYLDSNRAGNADGQDDFHACCFAEFDDNVTTRILFGARTPGTNIGGVEMRHSGFNLCRPGSDSGDTSKTPTVNLAQLLGVSRSSSSEYITRVSNVTTTVAIASGTPVSHNLHVFTRNDLAAKSNARISFYSIGSACDLAALDARTSHLMNSIRFTLLTGLSPADYDPATLAYLLAAYTAGGSLS